MSHSFPTSTSWIVQHPQRIDAHAEPDGPVPCSAHRDGHQRAIRFGGQVLTAPDANDAALLLRHLVRVRTAKPRPGLDASGAVGQRLADLAGACPQFVTYLTAEMARLEGETGGEVTASQVPLLLARVEQRLEQTH